MVDIDKLLAQSDSLLEKTKSTKKNKRGRPKGRRKETKSGKGYIYEETKSGRVLKHRRIMEEHLERELLPHEAVYFKNGNKEDFGIENLQLGVKPGRHSQIECPHCGKNILEKETDPS